MRGPPEGAVDLVGMIGAKPSRITKFRSETTGSRNETRLSVSPAGTKSTAPNTTTLLFGEIAPREVILSGGRCLRPKSKNLSSLGFRRKDTLPSPDGKPREILRLRFARSE